MKNDRKIIGEYNGFEIVKHYQSSSNSYFLAIYKDGIQKSILSLSTVKACKRVIDTYIRSEDYIKGIYEVA